MQRKIVSEQRSPGSRESSGKPAGPRRDGHRRLFALNLSLRTAALLPIAAALWTPASHAQGSPELAACAAIGDEGERLACYDSLARPGEAAPPSPASDRESESAQDPANRNSSVPDLARPRTGPPSSPTPAQPVQRPYRDDATPSSRNERPAKAGAPDNPASAPREPASPAEDFSATVVEVFQQPRGEHTVVLDNGQVWQENFASRYFPVEPGDKIRIRKRFFSGYRLITPSGKGFNVGQLR